MPTSFTFKQGASLVSNQYRFVQGVASEDHYVDQANSASDLTIGIQQNAPGDSASGIGVSIASNSGEESMLVIGNDINAYEELASDNAGRGRTAASGEMCNAVALQDGTSTTHIRVKIAHYNVD